MESKAKFYMNNDDVAKELHISQVLLQLPFYYGFMYIVAVTV